MEFFKGLFFGTLFVSLFYAVVVMVLYDLLQKARQDYQSLLKSALEDIRRLKCEACNKETDGLHNRPAFKAIRGEGS